MASDRRRSGESPVAFGVRTGRFSGARAPHWIAAYAADPDGTTKAIEAMVALPGVVATMRAPVADVELDDEFDHLFSPGFFSPIDGTRQVDASADADFDHLFPPTSTDDEPSEFDYLFAPGTFPRAPE